MGGYTYVSEDVSQVTSASLTSAVTAISGDLNNDGIEDVAEIDANTVLTVLLGNGNGGFVPAPAYNGNSGAHGPMLVGDFNGSGLVNVMGLDTSQAKIPDYYIFSAAGLPRRATAG